MPVIRTIPLSPADIAALADTPADLQQHVKDEITVLIGDSQSGQTDTLLSGRDAVRRALAESASSVPVRFAFFSKIGRFDFITVFVKPLSRPLQDFFLQHISYCPA